MRLTQRDAVVDTMIEPVAPTPILARRPPLDLLTLVAASVLLAMPFLGLHHVNTIDGPADVLGGRILGNLGNEPIVRHYYVVSFTVVTNVLAQLLLAALMVAVTPTWSEKILVAGYVVALPLAVRYAIRSVNPSAGWAALVWLPFVVSFMLLFGFYDFCYAMIGASNCDRYRHTVSGKVDRSMRRRTCVGARRHLLRGHCPAGHGRRGHRHDYGSGRRRRVVPPANAREKPGT